MNEQFFLIEKGLIFSEFNCKEILLRFITWPLELRKLDQIGYHIIP